MTIIIGPEGPADEFGNPLKGPVLDRFGQLVEPKKIIRADEVERYSDEIYNAHVKLIKDAEEFLSFYFTPDNIIEDDLMNAWIEKNPILNKLFLIHLIEIAGQKFLDGALRSHHSSAGQLGGKAKNKPTQDLKDWAMQQAKSLKMTYRDAARHLSARVPAHLADASTNPEQLIYRALLEKHKAK